MFEVEIIHLLNDYKTSDDLEKDKIKKSISKLIKENNSDFNKFISNSKLDVEIKNFLNDCFKEIQNNKEKKSDNGISDFDLINNKYLLWLKYFKANNNLPDSNCYKIIDEIINFYALNRFEVLEKLFEIVDSENFEKFKNMIKNNLRNYFAKKVENYYTSENYQNLNFFAKLKKKRQILFLLDEIGAYKFNLKKISEVL